MSERYAVILCGDSGTRLWPLSCTLRPNLALNGKETLLQQTALQLSRHVPVVLQNELQQAYIDFIGGA